MAGDAPGATAAPGLKKNAIGFWSALVIGLASTAPAYSLAATIGILTLDVGEQMPAVLLVSFVPMLFIATAYYYLNRADPDCGTTFAWATRALGPVTGWAAGWAIMTAGIIVIGLLANTAAVYTFLLFGLDSAAGSKWAVIALAVAMIAGLSWVTVIGIEISARTQDVLIVAQLGTLALFAVVALVRVAAGDGPTGSADPAASWFSPFAIDSSDVLVAGVLSGLFIYWGWDSAVTVNEESENSASSPGKAAVVSTVLLVGIYLLVGTACLAWLGAKGLGGFEDETAFNSIAEGVLGSPLDKLVVLSVLTSALAATQTTVLPSSRTALSMGRYRALPAALSHIHPRYLTPHVATITVAALSIVFYVLFNGFSESFYENALAALGLLICINYGLNGIACVVYYRRLGTRDARTFLFVLVAPLLGAAIFAAVLGKSVYDFTKDDEEATMWLGLQAPLVITIGLFVVAAVLMLAVRSSGGREFFARRRETADSRLLSEPVPAAGGS